MCTTTHISLPLFQLLCMHKADVAVMIQAVEQALATQKNRVITYNPCSCSRTASQLSLCGGGTSDATNEVIALCCCEDKEQGAANVLHRFLGNIFGQHVPS